MTLIVGPYVGRNYLITGQPLVTAQSGFAFWGTSIEKIGPGQPFIFALDNPAREYSLNEGGVCNVGSELSGDARDHIHAFAVPDQSLQLFGV